jgi:mandelate racemase
MKIEAVRTTPVLAPLPRPLSSASGYIERMPLVLIDVITGDGVEGRAYAQMYFPELLPALDRTIRGMGEMIVGMTLAPRDVHAFLQRRCRLFGLKNLMGAALGGLDMAVWDAWAQGRELPLCRALGAEPRAHRTYNSVGMYDAQAIVRVAEETRASGMAGLKIKVGFPTFAEDLALVRAARKTLGDGVALMIDYNQSLDVREALARCVALDGEGLSWIEEPVSADDFRGCAKIAAAVATPVQIGENFQGPAEMQAAVEAGAMDCVMLDAQFIHGVTGWLEAAALARVAGVPMSSHMFVEASAHLLCATPTAHWLECTDVAAGVLAQPTRVEGGAIAPADRPGIGMEWDPDAVRRCRVDQA